MPEATDSTGTHPMPTQPHQPVWQGGAPRIEDRPEPADKSGKNISSDQLESQEVDSIAAELKHELQADKPTDKPSGEPSEAPQGRRGRRHRANAKKHAAELEHEQTAPKELIKPVEPASDEMPLLDQPVPVVEDDKLTVAKEPEHSKDELNLRLAPRSEGRNGQPGALPADSEETPEDTIYIDQDGNFKQRGEDQA